MRHNRGMAIEDLVTPAYAARMKRCSRGAVYAAIKKGELPCQTVLGRIGLEMADVRKWEPAPYRARVSGARKMRGPGRPRRRDKSDMWARHRANRPDTGAVRGYSWLLGCGTELAAPAFSFGQASASLIRRDFLPAP